LPKGNTAFYDSVYAAIDKAESGKYQKKILIAFSDGQDNSSFSYKIDDVTKSLKQSDVLFYGISYSKDSNSLIGSIQGAAFLDAFSNLTGGKSFFPKTTNEIPGVFDRIALELKSQYQVGFQVANFLKPDKWREIKIKVTPVSDGNKQIKVQPRARIGFYPTSVK